MKKNKPLLILLFWTLFAIIDSLKKARALVDGEYVLFYHVPSYLIWIGLTFPLSSLFAWSEKFVPWKRGLVLLAVGIGAGVVKVMASWVTFYAGLKASFSLPPGSTFGEFISRVSLFYFMEAFIISWVVLIVFFILELYGKYKAQMLVSAELETELAKAHLETLKMQLRPHFLFNANNIVAMLIRKGEDSKAIEVLSRLSDLLRTSLDRKSSQLISLDEELNLVGKYLEIEAIRFEDMLEVQYDVDEDARQAMVPNFILQPLVENAFKHGISKSIDKGLITITCKKDSNQLGLGVFNTGPELDFTWKNKDEASLGIGLKNTIQRLKRLYDKQYSFNITNENGGVLVHIEIPLKRNPSNG